MTARLSPLPDTTQRLADAVYDRLGAAILEGELPGGSRVRDAEVAAQLGVSRMPVREALQRVQRIGLVEMSPSRYTRVTEVTPRLARESFEFLGYQVGTAARMSVTRMDDAARRHTLGMIDELLGLIDDPARYDEAAGRLFHHLAAPHPQSRVRGRDRRVPDRPQAQPARRPPDVGHARADRGAPGRAARCRARRRRRCGRTDDPPAPLAHRRVVGIRGFRASG